MDAADSAGRENADPGCARDRERAAQRRRPDCALDGGGSEVARPDLARMRHEAGELVLRQPDTQLSVEDADRRGDGSRGAHLPLGLQSDLDALAWREAVRYEGRLERDDPAVAGESLAHLVGDADHADRSISTNRLSSPRLASWNPARR